MLHKVEIKAGRRLSQREIDGCMAVIKEGCAVDPESAEKELPRSVWVAIVHAKEDIVAVGAVKGRRRRYALGIARDDKSGFAFDPQIHELGYVAVLEAHRGKHLSSRIVESLLDAFPGPLWATTDKERMRQSLAKRGFKQRGKAWTGSKGQLSLWIRESK